MTNQLNRRDFIRRATAAAAALPVLAGCRSGAVAQSGDALARVKRNAIPIDAEWNGAKDAPAGVAWRTSLVGPADEGERLIVSGTVFERDGKTPAPNVLIYLYHTDSKGLYGQRGEHRHDRFRGWMFTGKDGRYEFETVRPAPYPEQRFAAHIHMTVTTESQKEDWIDSILFEDDRLIFERERRDAGRKGGFNPILRPVRGDDNVWRATRDIKL
jgi:protocatechuate 3,4-dioxygenase beta subunit